MSSGSVRATSTTCSPNTIVYAEVESESGFRINPSRPHIAAAMLTRTTPGIVSRRRGIGLSLAIRLVVTQRSVTPPALGHLRVARPCAGRADRNEFHSVGTG